MQIRSPARMRKATRIIIQQFNSISPENVMKWEVIHPRPDAYDFTLADKYVEFGLKNHMFIVGHNLCWHAQTPAWVFKDEKGNPLTRDAPAPAPSRPHQDRGGPLQGKDR